MVEHLNNDQEHLNNDQTSEIEEHKNKKQHVAKIGDTWHYTGDVFMILITIWHC